MATDQDTSSKLSETLTMIEDVKKQESEINRLLDLIEQKRNKSTHSTSSSLGTDDEKTQSATGTSSSKSVHEHHTTEGNSSTATETAQDKPKGILKSPKLGSKDSYGFIEHFDLNENNVLYGSQLRRKYVQMNQDNRLCLRYGFEPNLGCRYSGPTVTCSQDPAGNGTRNKTKSNIQIISASSRVLPRVEGGRRSASPQNVPYKPTEGSHKTTRQPVAPSTRLSVVPNISNNEGTHGHEDLEKGKQTEMSQKQEEVTSGLTQEQLQQLTDYVCGESNKLLKPLGIQIDGEQFHDMSMMVAKRLSEGNFTIEDIIPMQQQMNDVLKDLCETSGDATLENLPELMNKAMRTVFGNKEPDEEADRRPDEDSDVEPAPPKTPSKSKPQSPGEPQSLPNPPSPPNHPSPVESQTSDSECEVEPVYMDITQWSLYAEQEKEHGKYAREIREKGLDTIFCLDISSSMKGIAWDQAKEFIRNFIEGILNSNLHDSVYEHVALVTFGGETKVQQHLTCDYLEITRKLDRLKPGGTSPLYAGLQMCQAAVLGAGAVFVSNGYKMHPRIFLLTDGKVTDAGLVHGPDKYSSLSDIEEVLILGQVKSLSDKLHTKVYPIPVGSFELPLLEKIAKVSEGKIVSPNDWALQTKTFKNYLSAARVKKELFGDSPEIFQYLYNEAYPGTSSEDMAQMLEFLCSQKQEADSDDEEKPGLPPLGSRIRRSVTGKLLGTVTKHFADDHVGVTWDEALPNGSIREKVEYEAGQPSLTIVNEPRVLHNELILVGCRVQRGADWRYNQQDGGPGNHGSVFDVGQNGIVKVRWDNGSTYSYRFGAEGKFDVDIVPDERKPNRQTKITMIQPSSHEEAEKKRIQEMNERNKAPADNIGEAPVDVRKGRADVVGRSDRAGATGYTPSESVRSKHIDGYKTTQKSDEKIGACSRISASKADREDRSKSASSVASPSTVNVQWMWQDGETWRIYPPDVNEKIESNYVKHPTGTCVIQMQDQHFRIAFSQMKQINIDTRVKVAVKRSTGIES